MWTTENRHRYGRDKLRYPSDTSLNRTGFSGGSNP
jgi:hypothetical protein